MGWSVQCPMCGAQGNLNPCKGCNLWFCGNHLFRHKQCKEGR